MRAALVASLAAALALVAALGGCLKKSEKYCGLHAADDPTHCPPPDAPPMTACTTSAECMGATPACDTVNSTCVACFGSDDMLCADQQLVCGADNTCVPCTMHDQCASKLCTFEGTCAPASMIAYVADTGGGGDCTQSIPCKVIDDARKLNRPYIKVTGPISEPGQVTFANGSTEIYGDGNARVMRGGTGPIFEIKGTGTSVEIYGLRLSNALGAGILMTGGPSLALTRVIIDECSGLGVSAPNGGTLTMSRCVISGNNGGGVDVVDGMFTLTNNLFVLNGDGSASNIGGLRLSAAVGATPTFEFNTVADNFNTTGNVTTRGLNCASALTVNNNIFVNNQIGATCLSNYGLFDATAPVTGTMNKTGQPRFISTTAQMPAATTYYRIGPTSAAIDSADPGATATFDIDGDARPGNGRSDIGADESN